MLDTRFLWAAAKSGVTRAAMSAVLALWCVFALASGDARAICLDLGGNCASSATVPVGSCHEAAPGADTNSSCGSCVDIVVHEDVSANSSRPDHGLRAPAVAQSPGALAQSASHPGDAIAVLPTYLNGSPSQYPFVRIVVLRI